MNRQQLIEDNMNLVYFLISKRYPTFIGDDDIAQCGMIGLCRAADTWNEDKSAFSTYASSCILNEIKREFRTRCKHQDTLSLDYTYPNEEGQAPLGDFIVGMDDVDIVDDTPFYNQLNSLERQIVGYKRQGLTTAEIAEKLGCKTRSITYYLRKLRYLWRITYAD